MMNEDNKSNNPYIEAGQLADRIIEEFNSAGRFDILIRQAVTQAFLAGVNYQKELDLK